MKVQRFHCEAEAELLAQVAYYESVSRGLGARFLKEVIAALDLVGQFSKSGSPYKSGTRRVFPKGFGYSLVYLENEAELYVVTVASFSRKPGRYSSRKVLPKNLCQIL